MRIVPGVYEYETIFMGSLDVRTILVAMAEEGRVGEKGHGPDSRG